MRLGIEDDLDGFGLIGRLVHKTEIASIDGDSYRAKEARERAEKKAKDRKAKTKERGRKQ